MTVKKKGKKERQLYDISPEFTNFLFFSGNSLLVHHESSALVSERMISGSKHNTLDYIIIFIYN